MSTVVKAIHQRTEESGLAMWGLWETLTKGVLVHAEVEMEDKLERGEDLIIGRNKEVLVSNLMFNMFNRKM